MDFDELEQYHEDIENAYKCYDVQRRILAYFYALKRKGGLGFEYHILQRDDENEFKIENPQNTLSLLQESDYDLQPIKKDSDEYEEFLDYLDATIRDQKRR